jgi:hypothetical protein
LGAQGSTLELFSALANAKGLRHLNLFSDSGLQGPLAPMLSPSTATICAMAWRSLSTLTADGVQLVGGIPPCLLSNSSKLVELHLGAPHPHPAALAALIGGLLDGSLLSERTPVSISRAPINMPVTC